jgi:hypothetical protein
MQNILKTTGWVIVFALATVSLSGQTNAVKQYYEYVNKAELAVCDDNYKEASDYYWKAFEMLDPFERDIWHAWKTFVCTNNLDRTLSCAHLMAQRGLLSLDDMPYCVKFTDDVKYSEVFDIMKNILDTTRMTIIPYLDSVLQEILDMDQRVRVRDYDYLEGKQVYDNGTPALDYDKWDTPEWSDIVRQTDANNVNKIKELYKQHGHLSSKITSQIGTILCVFNNNPIEIPQELLLDEVLHGYYDVRNYMFLIERFQSIYKLDTSVSVSTLDPVDNILKGCSEYAFNYSFFYINNDETKTYFIIEPQDVEKVNANRKKLGFAETWDDYMIKNLYSIKQLKQIDDHLLYSPGTPASFDYIWFYSPPGYSFEDNDEVVSRIKQNIDSGKIKGKYWVEE